MPIRILFQGDSITDAGRDRNDPHNMGNGYPLYAAELIRKQFPDTEFEFINLGISGNRSDNLLARMEKDLIDLQPDFVSVMIGTNDFWHRYIAHPPVLTTDEQYRENYRTVLTAIKERTNAKLMMIEPYLFRHSARVGMRPELLRINEICRDLAWEFADAFLPLDGLIAKAEIECKELNVFSGDGVHPNATGAQFIARHYVDAAAPLIRSIIK